jgi:hypothetical protein
MCNIMDRMGQEITKDGYTQDIAWKYQVEMNELISELTEKARNENDSI